jgi:glycosyltransferase involved in cell wall biosynthesis
MNIYVLISSLNYSGAEKQMIIDANLLSKSHNVTILTFSDGPQRANVLNSVKLIILEKRNYFASAIKLARMVRLNKVDIIISALFASINISSMASAITHIPVIWIFHSRELHLPLRSKILYWLNSRVAGVKKILFVSQELKTDLMARLRLPQGKCDALYNSSQFFHADTDVERNYHKSILTIGYIGRVIELKRVHILVHIAEYLLKQGITNFRIGIVGDGSKLDDVKRYAKERNVDSLIDFLGFQNNVAPFYAACDVFLNPSMEECLSLALIDAGILGLPCVAFDVGGNKEIISDGISGFIVSSNEEFLTRAEQLIRNEELRKQFGSAAQQICSKKFSISEHERMLNKFVKIAAGE